VKIENLIKEVFGRGFTIGAGNADGGEVRVIENGVSGFFNNSFFVDDLIGFKKKKRKEKKEKRKEGESEGQEEKKGCFGGPKRERGEDYGKKSEEKKKTRGVEKEFSFESKYKRFFLRELMSKRMFDPPGKKSLGGVAF